MLLAIGVAVTSLITDLFARNQEIGWLGLVSRDPSHSFTCCYCRS